MVCRTCNRRGETVALGTGLGFGGAVGLGVGAGVAVATAPGVTDGLEGGDGRAGVSAAGAAIPGGDDGAAVAWTGAGATAVAASVGAGASVASGGGVTLGACGDGAVHAAATTVTTTVAAPSGSSERIARAMALNTRTPDREGALLSIRNRVAGWVRRLLRRALLPPAQGRGPAEWRQRLSNRRLRGRTNGRSAQAPDDAKLMSVSRPSPPTGGRQWG